MPASKGLKIDVRRKRILEILARDGQVRVAQISEELGVTPVTVRSDLSALKEDGYLERISGGAIQTVKNFYNLEFQQRRQQNAFVKKRIASAAADLIQDGETLFINSGTTTYYTAIELKRHKSLNIVTNSLLVAMELGDVPTFRVILLGGDINTQYSFTYGVNVLEQLKQFKADKTILSMDGISVNSGLTTYHAEEAVVTRAMVERAGKTILVADHSKIGYESFSFVLDLSAASCLVTDAGDNAAPKIRELKAAGLETITVDWPGV
ncbi:MAG: DeoR/GlpR family DNA-binding transcription regulator [Spirochaetaceae bacterium]|jgi:DeoR/GlpR family transcriptional regulator of sugar metabolism|nr:DeoR/GlpR family DNA-binding transcription regulator [Spirochaetaceae bacterium]